MKNRLKYSLAYLVGPMEHDREAGKNWRIMLAEWLLKEIQVISFDPYHKPLHSIHKEALEDENNYQRALDAITKLDKEMARAYTKPIVHTDLRIVDRVDFIVAYLDVDNNPCGTYDEIFTASNQNKPVIINCPQGVRKVPRWMWGRLRPELFFDEWESIKKYLLHIAFDEDEKIDCIDRWKFFDLEKKILEIVCQNYILTPTIGELQYPDV